jgi:hypothetical protein
MFLFSFIGLEDIAKYCPNLETLDVGWCQEETCSGVKPANIWITLVSFVEIELPKKQ